jgi:hypothetical protein
VSSVLSFPSAPAASTRGGASANAWGSEPRLDKLSLQGPSEIGGVLIDVVSGIQPERTLWLESFKDAVFNYKFYGLGRNGTCRDEFWYSCEYLFNVRSYLPSTWQGGRVIREVAEDETGKRRNRVVRIPDDVLMFQCLDQHWSYFDFRMSLESFCKRLKAERRGLLERNWPQVARYLHLNHLTFESCAATLTYPSEPDQLTDLLYSSRTSRLAVAA